MGLTARQLGYVARQRRAATRVVGVSSVPASDKAACAIYLVDGAKGTIVYHAVLPSVDGACDVKATLVENWLVYHYYDNEAGPGHAKGYRVVSVELYEGHGVDEKTRRCVCEDASASFRRLTACVSTARICRPSRTRRRP